MSNPFDLLIKNASVVAPDLQSGQLRTEICDVGIKNGLIAAIGQALTANSAQILDASNLTLIPGVIDSQVHFRDPGFPEKEDLKSGTRAAIFGGVTSIFDMPNTSPPTLGAIDIQDKITRAKGQTWCHHAFYMGVSPVNADRLEELEVLPGVCGVKMFMGSSTGNLVVGSDEVISIALKRGKRRMAIHAEDETRLIERKKIVTASPGDVSLHPVWRDEQTAFLATEKILRMAEAAGRPVHILHVTTAEEMELLAQKKSVASVEVTPQHLTLSAPVCYERLGTLAQMNPPIRSERHQKALWDALQNGVVDVIGSDHAPHTLKEKAKTYPDSPSGMTGVQTLLPIMLHHSLNGKLSLHKLVELTSQNPARLFKIKNKGQIRVGFDADLTLVDLKAKKKIENSWIQSTCGWTPYDGMTLDGKVVGTLIKGQVAMRDEQLIGRPRGELLSFDI